MRVYLALAVALTLQVACQGARPVGISPDGAALAGSGVAGAAAKEEAVRSALAASGVTEAASWDTELNAPQDPDLGALMKAVRDGAGVSEDLVQRLTAKGLDDVEGLYSSLRSRQAEGGGHHSGGGLDLRRLLAARGFAVLDDDLPGHRDSEDRGPSLGRPRLLQRRANEARPAGPEDEDGHAELRRRLLEDDDGAEHDEVERVAEEKAEGAGEGQRKDRRSPEARHERELKLLDAKITMYAGMDVDVLNREREKYGLGRVQIPLGDEVESKLKAAEDLVGAIKQDYNRRRAEGRLKRPREELPPDEKARRSAILQAAKERSTLFRDFLEDIDGRNLKQITDFRARHDMTTLAPRPGQATVDLDFARARTRVEVVELAKQQMAKQAQNVANFHRIEKLRSEKSEKSSTAGNEATEPKNVRERQEKDAAPSGASAGAERAGRSTYREGGRIPEEVRSRAERRMRDARLQERIDEILRGMPEGATPAEKAERVRAYREAQARARSKPPGGGGGDQSEMSRELREQVDAFHAGRPPARREGGGEGEGNDPDWGVWKEKAEEIKRKIEERKEKMAEHPPEDRKRPPKVKQSMEEARKQWAKEVRRRKAGHEGDGEGELRRRSLLSEQEAPSGEENPAAVAAGGGGGGGGFGDWGGDDEERMETLDVVDTPQGVKIVDVDRVRAIGGDLEKRYNAMKAAARPAAGAPKRSPELVAELQRRTQMVNRMSGKELDQMREQYGLVAMDQMDGFDDIPYPVVLSRARSELGQKLRDIADAAAEKAEAERKAAGEGGEADGPVPAPGASVLGGVWRDEVDPQERMRLMMEKQQAEVAARMGRAQAQHGGAGAGGKRIDPEAITRALQEAEHGDAGANRGHELRRRRSLLGGAGADGAGGPDQARAAAAAPLLLRGGRAGLPAGPAHRRRPLQDGDGDGGGGGGADTDDLAEHDEVDYDANTVGYFEGADFEDYDPAEAADRGEF